MATPEEIQAFKNRWLFWPIAQSARMRMEILNLSGELKKLVDNFYFAKAGQFTISRKIRRFIKKYIYYTISKEEQAIIDHTLGKELLDIWSENIEGVKKGFRVDAQRNIEFFSYLYKQLEIMHNPDYSETYENFQNLGFSLKLLRPNNQAHIYLSFSFVMRPLKKFIAEYLRMSVITGDYEILFRRFPPWHFMLALNVAPGQRTLWDHRGLDFPPIIYKLDLKYTLALELNNIQTRSNDRFISCPIVNDLELEKHKNAELQKFDEDLKGIFSHKGYIFGAQFDEDGRVYLDKGPKKKDSDRENDRKGFKRILYQIGRAFVWIKDKIVELFMGKKEEEREKEFIEMYGAKRARYLGIEAQANLMKAIPTPSTDSGLVIRFNLLHPIAVLLEGINRRKDITLDEIPYLWKSLDIIKGELFKPQAKRRSQSEIVDEVFSNPNPMGVAAETLAIIQEIEKIRAENPEDPTEEKAWKYFIARMVEGKGGLGQPILQALCTFLLPDGFDVVFSIWPLITGNEISIDHTTGKVEEKPWKEKKTLLPLLDVLKKELEDLLTNVFTKYIDISAATKRARSESRLSGIIVEYCLNTKMDEETFREKLRSHLKEHYLVHFDFFKEYLKEQKPTVLRQVSKFYNLKIEKTKTGQEIIGGYGEQLEKDMESIIDLIHNARERLYSPSVGSRLLNFIDPYSVDIHIGDFHYKGMGFEKEEEFIIAHEKRQFELAEEMSKKRAQVDAFDIERMGNKQIVDGKHIVLKVQEGLKMATAESEQRLREVELQLAISETKKKAVEALMNGNFKEYGLLSLIQAHADGGIEAVEKVLHHSHTMLMAIDPHLHEHQIKAEFRKRMLKLFEDNPEKINPLSVAMLLNTNVESLTLPEFYKNMAEKFEDIFKNHPRLAGLGMIGPGGMMNPGMMGLGGMMGPGMFGPLKPTGSKKTSGNDSNNDQSSSNSRHLEWEEWNRQMLESHQNANGNQDFYDDKTGQPGQNSYIPPDDNGQE